MSKLPPLPKPDTHCFDEDTGKDVWSHSPEQMQAYAIAACADRDARIAELERETGQLLATLAEARKDAERWLHACKGNNKQINVCSWDNDAMEWVGYAMKKESIDSIADAEIESPRSSPLTW